MRKVISISVVLVMVVALCPFAFATNGINLIGIGAIARSMGGVGTAAPQDAISAVFANPAAMCTGPWCPASEFNFAGTLFAPNVEAKATFGPNTLDSSSEKKVYPIPAIGISTPLKEGPRPLRFGLAAYGVSGLGVDYRSTDLDNPMVAGSYSELQQMKFAGAIAYQVLPNLSIGVAPVINYSNLDLRNGAASAYSLGFQAGLILTPIANLSLGLQYVSPQKNEFSNVLEFNGNNYGLDLENPQQVSFGVAYEFFENRLLVEADAKWLNWSDAKGFEDFDWDDQWVFAIGAQFEVISNLYLRAGYNYGENPVKKHNGFNGAGITRVQGVDLPTVAYESFRVIGLPAIVEHHITAGLGYRFSDRFSLDLGLVHAFEETLKESGTFGDMPVTYESTLHEWSLDLGLTWRF